MLKLKKNNYQDYQTKRVHIEVTNECNFNCNFCPNSFSIREKKCIDFVIFKKIIEDISKNKITNLIDFHVLGEPLLYPKIFDAIKYAKHHDIKTALTTNGYLLDKKVINKLSKAGLDLLIISVISPMETDFSKRSKKKDFNTYYKKILESVNHALNISSSFKINLTLWEIPDDKTSVFNQNFWKTQKKLKIKFMKLAKEVLLTNIDKKTDFHKIRNKINYNIIINAIFIWKKYWINKNLAIATSKFFNWGNAFTEDEIYPANSGYCIYGNDSIGILSNGDVVICCIDYDGNVVLGNIKSDSLSSILKKEYTMKLKSGIKKSRFIHPYCRKCFGCTNKLNTSIKSISSILFLRLIMIIRYKIRKY